MQCSYLVQLTLDSLQFAHGGHNRYDPVGPVPIRAVRTVFTVPTVFFCIGLFASASSLRRCWGRLKRSFFLNALVEANET
jgi:hypothetical protein